MSMNVRIVRSAGAHTLEVLEDKVVTKFMDLAKATRHDLRVIGETLSAVKRYRFRRHRSKGTFSGHRNVTAQGVGA